MSAPDPMEQLIASARSASDQQVATYREHLRGLVRAWRKHMHSYDQATLIQNSVKSLMEGDNTREDLCYQVMVLVDMMARRINFKDDS
jgi:sulfur transfer complex TusBCD TusB component (DsrH family)